MANFQMLTQEYREGGVAALRTLLTGPKRQCYLDTIVNENMLHQTAASGMTEVCVLCVEQGIDVNSIYRMTEFDYDSAADHRKETALHRAAQHGHIDTCQALLELGAKIDAVDDFGSTPLCYAAQNQQLDTCLWLLSKRANRSIVDSEHSVAYDYLPRDMNIRRDYQFLLDQSLV